MWLKKESEGQSVSLTLMTVAFVAFLIASGLEIFQVIKSTGPLFELFGTTVALYFGRKLNIRGKTFSSSKSDETK